MVEEVEAQIERALASMAVDMEPEDSDYDSRPGSPRSVGSRSRSRPTSRRTSNAGQPFPMRSFGTESTLAEAYEEDTPRANHDVIEEEEEPPVSPTKKKRFSATAGEAPQDAMTAVDEGIHDTSDRIAQKVLQIQEKVRFHSELCTSLRG